jgi:alpha-beta hydrolase superfamily lysophospholipase
MSKRSLPARIVRWVAGAALVVLLLVIGGTFARAWLLAPAAPIAAWHTEVPPEIDPAAIDAGDWAAYLAAEDAAFAFVRDRVTKTLPPGERLPLNRFFSGSPIYPPHFVRDWNRSFILEPVGPPRGVVVLLHGLTDSPYSLRHVAQLYQARGWTAVAIRMPGHGTAPAGLANAEWPDWAAATRLAMREAARRANGGPIELIGYSNGGALAVQYALAAARDPALAKPRRVILLSPMIGLTEFARFSGVAGWPAIVPAFAKAAWLDIVPEYNPFKYNSFPVNAARESFRLTAALQASIAEAVADGSIKRLPPILTFQSLVDSTVSTPAVVTELYDHLANNGSELVIFDINRNATIAPMLRPAVANRLATMLPAKARPYRVTVITNVSPTAADMIERTTAPGSAAATDRRIGLTYPDQVYSISHIAMPFPPFDGLYGSAPNPNDDFGIELGALAARGERGVLTLSLDTLLRLSSNPFYPYIADRIAPVP